MHSRRACTWPGEDPLNHSDPIKSTAIAFERPAETFFLDEYNDLLAKRLVENFDDTSYRASAVFNRAEAQTHLFERIERYRQIHQLAAKGQVVVLEAGDQDFYSELHRDFPGRVRLSRAPVAGAQSKLQFFRILFLLFLVSSLIAVVAWVRRRLQGTYDLVIRSYFDYRCIDARGAFREEYFGRLVPDAATENRTLVIYRLIHYRDVLRFFKVRANGQWDTSLAEGLAGLFGVVRAYGRFLLSGPIRLSVPMRYRGLDVTKLVQKALVKDFRALGPLTYFVEEEVATKIFGRLKPRVVLLPFENLPWEKAHCRIRTMMRASTKVIGFQHTGLSLKLLNYFPSKLEAKLPQFPDRILTVGETLKQLLLKKAHYSSDILVGCALRHDKWFEGEALKFLKADPTAKMALAYAFSYDQGKYRAIFDALISTLGDSGIKVYLKIHPLYDENELVRRFGVHLPSNFVLAQKLAWSDLYRQIDVVLYDDNSIALEGILNGVKTLQLDVGEPIYNCDRMFDFKVWNPIVSVAGLTDLRRELEGGQFAKAYDEPAAQTYVRNYLAPYVRDQILGRFLL